MVAALSIRVKYLVEVERQQVSDGSPQTQVLVRSKNLLFPVPQKVTLFRLFAFLAICMPHDE